MPQYIQNPRSRMIYRVNGCEPARMYGRSWFRVGSYIDIEVAQIESEDEYGRLPPICSECEHTD